MNDKSNIKILVIEDDVNNSEMVEEFLSDMGY